MYTSSYILVLKMMRVELEKVILFIPQIIIISYRFRFFCFCLLLRTVRLFPNPPFAAV